MNRKYDPSIMASRFRKMSLDDINLFMIRKLNTVNSRMESPSVAVRSEIHCFIFIEAGKAIISIGDELCVINAGECAVIPAGQIFSVKYYDNCVGYMGGFHTDFLRRFELIRGVGFRKVLFEPQKISFISNLFVRLYYENINGRDMDIVRAYLNALLMEMGSCKTDGAIDYNKCENGSKSAICNKFIEMVFEKPNRMMDMKSYAGKLNVTTGYLYKVVKKITERSPLEWIDEAVVLESKSLLINTTLPVNEISASVGLMDASYFSRYFKKHVGVTPVEFRKSAK